MLDNVDSVGVWSVQMADTGNLGIAVGILIHSLIEQAHVTTASGFGGRHLALPASGNVAGC